jgi:hypothetical protein
MDKITVTRALGTGDAALEVSANGYGCMGLDCALTLEAHHHQQCLARAADFADGLAAFIDKRQPTFADRRAVAA